MRARPHTPTGSRSRLVNLAICAGLIAWWLPTIAAAVLGRLGLYVQARAALWLAHRLLDAGQVEAARWILERSRARLATFGARRGWTALDGASGEDDHGA